ncbi:MAG: hypothetical protein AAFQ82_00425, partial [Myxococcota bacterium]
GRLFITVVALTAVSCATRTATPVPAPESAPEKPPIESAEAAPEPAVNRKITRSKSPEPAPDTSADEEVRAEPLAEAAPAVASSNRCVVGAVRARGDIVVAVKNATVTLFKGPNLLGETRTDENGKFAWCAGPSLGGDHFEITVRVSKAPFKTISQSRAWQVGTQEEFDFAMEADGL